jgi:hypothetical protein
LTTISPVIACLVVIAALAEAHGAAAQNKPAARNGPPAAATNAAAPAVAAQADRLIKEMSAYIGSANEFTFHADVSFDHVLPSGRKLLFSGAEEVVLKRPGGLYVEWNGDLGARQYPIRLRSRSYYRPFYSGSHVIYEVVAKPA